MTLRADVRRARPVARRARARRTVGEVLLWSAAALGVVCLLFTVGAFLFHITLIMFRTGSMEPAIPTGSVAVVKEIPASEISVGDVVTVDRGPDELPVTHRVTTVAEGSTADERIVTMRGDANASDDPFPYTVTTVREVLFSIPGVAPVVASFGTPLVMGALTLSAGALVGWAFWPRRDDDADRAEASP